MGTHHDTGEIDFVVEWGVAVYDNLHIPEVEEGHLDRGNTCHWLPDVKEVDIWRLEVELKAGVVVICVVAGNIAVHQDSVVVVQEVCSPHDFDPNFHAGSLLRESWDEGPYDLENGVVGVENVSGPGTIYEVED
jgi:hypothetical protein